MKTSSPFRSAAAMTTLAVDESSSEPEKNQITAWVSRTTHHQEASRSPPHISWGLCDFLIADLDAKIGPEPQEPAPGLVPGSGL
jgi:hypothetical protein